MSRAACALLPLLMLALASATPLALGQGAGVGGFTFPTTSNFHVGGINVTTWVMHDTTSLAANADPRNPLGGLFNYNFTVGTGGYVFLRLEPLERNETFEVEAKLNGTTPYLQAFRFPTTAPQEGVPVSTGTEGCQYDDVGARCFLNSTTVMANTAFNFATALTMPPGSTPLKVEVRVFTRQPDQPPVFKALGNHTFTLNILPSIPAGVNRATAGGVELVVWPLSVPQALTPGGCLVNYPPNTTLTRGRPSSLCVVALASSDSPVRVNVSADGPPSLGFLAREWTSKPFTRLTAGLDAPVVSLVMHPEAGLATGPAQVKVHFRVERQVGNDTWVPAGEADVPVPLEVSSIRVSIRGGGPEVNWLFMGPAMAVTAAGLAATYQRGRRPRLQPRSQAMRDEMARKSKRREPESAEATAIEVEQQREDAKQASWDKKRQILEAKREDVLKTIRVAEERQQRGEITEHVLNAIRERKERQLEQIEQEMEELR